VSRGRGRNRGRGALALVLAVAALAAGCGRPPADLDAHVDRVLIVSLPGVDWRTVQRSHLPNLERFARTAAVADLSTRIGKRAATTTDAYLTMGAGTRAVAPEVDRAVALDADESYAGVPAGQLVQRRLGTTPEGIAYLAIGAAIDANDHSAFGAEVGSLGDRLAKAGVARAVVANADGVEGVSSDDPADPDAPNPLPDSAYDRGAATTLMGSDGIVPGGTVGRDLLVSDPTAPFGRRLDPTRVVAEVDTALSAGPRSVVLVEASDLARAAAYRPDAAAGQRAALRDRALRDADSLLGRLLGRIDPRHDAVIVVSPVAPSSLGIAAVQAPGIHGGLLESATTRRAGYVQLADVAPTVLSLFGVDAPESMEGRSFAVGDQGASDRIARLADSARAADFRDATLVPAVLAIIAGLCLLTLATLLRDRLDPRWRRLLAPLAYAALGMVPASFLVGAVGPVRANVPGQLAVVGVLAVAVALVAERVDRRRPGLGPLVAVGSIVGLIVLDVFAGAPLQLNTTFGYSVTVAGRFTGIGNLAFALFGSATVCLAALVADRYGDRGVRPAVILLAAVVAVEGLPMLGADVGGVLAMVPAFGVTALMLAGRRIRVRDFALLVAGAGALLFAFALIDAARPPELQTHLARVADNVVHGHWGLISKTLGRRWQASLGGATLAGWTLVVGATVAAAGYVVAVARGWLGPGTRRILEDRPTRAAAAGLALLAAAGLVANDSSIAVPATMLIVIGPVGILRALMLDRRAAAGGPRPETGARPPAPAPAPAVAAEVGV